MALKRQHQPMAAFSMSSMTDVIFLLLIFFMVTSTIIFPAAIQVDLPQSTEQTTLKPVTEVYVDSLSHLYIVADRNAPAEADRTPRPVSPEELRAALGLIHSQDSLRSIALYADSKVPYGTVVQILDMSARDGLRMVLATRAPQTSQPTETPALQ